MTRLISNSTRSSWVASTDGGTGEPGLPGELSIGVLAALLTGLPGRAGPRFPGRRPSTGRQAHPAAQCPTRSWGDARAEGARLRVVRTWKGASTPPARRAGRLLA